MLLPHSGCSERRHIPRLTFTDEAGRATEVTLVAGALDGKRAPAPPPRSWASRADTDVAIWTIRMRPGAVWTLPGASDLRSLRTLYFFEGSSLKLGEHDVRSHGAIDIQSSADVRLENGDAPSDILVLQGRPIGEPVVQHGPFVMNSREEIQRAFADYQRTRFGGWPWPSDEPVHPRDAGRFAKHADGRVERPRAK